MRAADYIITTMMGLFLAYVVATPVARFIDKSFTEASTRLEEMGRG